MIRTLRCDLLLNVLVIFILLAGVWGEGACAAAVDGATNTSRFVGVTPAEAREIMAQDENVVVVDVRTLRERKEVALPGSIHREMRMVLREGLDIDSDRPILLYCAVGGRSYAVGRVLAAKGFTTIYNLKGGIKAWQDQGYDVVRGEP